jgi:NTE family protein
MLPADAQAPRVGIALSGGAARGLAHIGVLRVLERAGIPVDVISGTSMGSVVGGLYAVGYSADQLDTIVRAQDWSRLLTDPVDRRDLPIDRKTAADHLTLTLPIHRGGIQLPRSLVPGQRIWELLTRLTWSAHGVHDFHRLPTPFAAVATNLETGQAVVLDQGFLPDAIRASMALPSVFAPVELGGGVLIDGGVVRNLPAHDARALGADVLICSDVTDPLEPPDSIVSLVDVLAQSVSFRVWDSERIERAACDVLIVPDVRAFTSFGFGRAAELIARGEAAARAALPEIEAKVGRRRVAPRPPAPAPPDSVLVTAVHFDISGGTVSPAFLAHALGLTPPTWTSFRDLGARVERLYATGLFANVRYRLEHGELTLLIGARPAGRFGLGLRYDSRYKASVLLTGASGGVELDARLGQQIRVGLGATRALGDAQSVSLGARLAYAHEPVDLFQGGRRVAEARVDLGAISASVYRRLGSVAGATLRVKAEHARWAEEVAAVDTAPINRTFVTVAGVADVDTYDSGVFPSRGVGLRAVSEWSGAFSHQLGDARGYLPLGRRVSLWAGATVGASGGTPPPHYLFYLGGANSYDLFPDRTISFAGLYVQERRGRHVQKAELGAQWQLAVAPALFARVRWNAGTVLDRWTFDPAGWVNGVGVELGARTVAGRVSLSVSGTAHSTPIVELDLGYPF